jgi:hypothetical protein
MDDDDDDDGGDLLGDYEDGEFDMQDDEDEYGLGGIIQVDPSRYANFDD